MTITLLAGAPTAAAPATSGGTSGDASSEFAAVMAGALGSTEVPEVPQVPQVPQVPDVPQMLELPEAPAFDPASAVLLAMPTASLPMTAAGVAPVVPTLSPSMGVPAMPVANVDASSETGDDRDAAAVDTLVVDAAIADSTSSTPTPAATPALPTAALPLSTAPPTALPTALSSAPPTLLPAEQTVTTRPAESAPSDSSTPVTAVDSPRPAESVSLVPAPAADTDPPTTASVAPASVTPSSVAPALAPTVSPAPIVAPVSAAPATAPTPVPLATQVAGPIFTLASAAPGEHVITIAVTPDNLGPVTVRAHVGGDGIRMELFAPTDGGRDALRAILSDLRRDLAAAGSGSAMSLDLSSKNEPSGDGTSRRDQRLPTPASALANDAGRRDDSGDHPFRRTSWAADSTIDVLA